MGYRAKGKINYGGKTDFSLEKLNISKSIKWNQTYTKHMFGFKFGVSKVILEVVELILKEN